MDKYEWESPRPPSRSRGALVRRLAGLSGAVVAVWAIATKVTGIQ